MQQPYLTAYQQIPADGSVLDIGCLGFQHVAIAQQLGLTDLRHAGVDFVESNAPLPEGFEFRKADLNQEPLPFADDRFDLVVASHVIEHLRDPVAFFGECVRVCKPGGLIYVAAPSERSLLLPGMPFEHHKFYSLSFFDDPTHMARPWSPQAFYRLTCYYSCIPIETGYVYGSLAFRLFAPLGILWALLTRNGGLLEMCCWEAIGWAAFLLAQKPATLSGAVPLQYDVPNERSLYTSLFLERITAVIRRQRPDV